MSIEPVTTKDRVLIVSIIIALGVGAGFWLERADAWLGASIAAESVCIDGEPKATVTVTGDDEHDATVTGDIGGPLPMNGVLTGEVALEPGVVRVIKVSVTRVGGGNKSIPLKATVTGRADCAPIVEPPPPTVTPEPEPEPSPEVGGDTKPIPRDPPMPDIDQGSKRPPVVTYVCGAKRTEHPDGTVTYEPIGVPESTCVETGP